MVSLAKTLSSTASATYPLPNEPNLVIVCTGGGDNTAVKAFFVPEGNSGMGLRIRQEMIALGGQEIGSWGYLSARNQTKVARNRDDYRTQMGVLNHILLAVKRVQTGLELEAAGVSEVTKLVKEVKGTVTEMKQTSDKQIKSAIDGKLWLDVLLDKALARVPVLVLIYKTLKALFVHATKICLAGVFCMLLTEFTPYELYCIAYQAHEGYVADWRNKLKKYNQKATSAKESMVSSDPLQVPVFVPAEWRTVLFKVTVPLPVPDSVGLCPSLMWKTKPVVWKPVPVGKPVGKYPIGIFSQRPISIGLFHKTPCPYGLGIKGSCTSPPSSVKGSSSSPPPSGSSSSSPPPSGSSSSSSPPPSGSSSSSPPPSGSSSSTPPPSGPVDV